MFKIMSYVLSFGLLLTWTGCGDATSESSGAVKANVFTISGKVVDNYIQSATVFADINNNNVLDLNETFVLSDENGSYKLSLSNGLKDDDFNIIAFNGVETTTGDKYIGILKNSRYFVDNNEQVNLTPLSTFFVEYMRKNGLTFTEADSLLRAYFMLNSENIFADQLSKEATETLIRTNLYIATLAKCLSLRLNDTLDSNGYQRAMQSILSLVDTSKTIKDSRILSIGDKSISISAIISAIKNIATPNLVQIQFSSDYQDIIYLGQNLPSALVIGEKEVYLPYEIGLIEDNLNENNATLYSVNEGNVSGFVYTSSSTVNSSNSNQLLDTIVNKLLTDYELSIASMASISKSVLSEPIDTTTAQYRVQLSNAKQSSVVDLSSNIMTKINNVINNKNDILVDETISNEPKYREFRLYLTVQYIKEDDVVVLASLSSEGNYEKYSGLVTSLSDSGNIGTNKSEIDSITDSFIGSATANKADFLFVIDDSGSMSKEQKAIKSAATSFKKTLSQTGIDVHMGIISTSYNNSGRVLKGGGVFKNDFETFASSLVLGTNGSGRETGIFNAEYALKSINEGDEVDGAFTQAGYPRENSSLSVIILSDEASQYPSVFDTNINVFTRKGYFVYSIVNPNDRSGSQYEALSQSTQGSVADINNLDSFDAIMDDIAIKAGGASSVYKLSQRPQVSTIVVKINGREIQQSRIDGWQYIATSNKIVLYSDARAKEGEDIDVSYSYIVPPKLIAITFKDMSSIVTANEVISPNLFALFDNGNVKVLFRDIVFTSSNIEVATVEKGLINTYKTGKTIITAEYENQTTQIELEILNAIDIAVIEGSISGGWSLGESWHVSKEDASNGKYSFSNAINGRYKNNDDSSITSPSMDFSTMTNASLSFSHKYRIEYGDDVATVEVSLDDGVTWQVITKYESQESSFKNETINLSAYLKENNVKVRFHFTSDSSRTYSGWYIDDIKILSN